MTIGVNEDIDEFNSWWEMLVKESE